MEEAIRLQRIAQVASQTFSSHLPGPLLLAKLAGGAFVALGAALFFGQTYIIYPSYAPSGSRTNVPTPAQHHMPHYEDLTLETPDNLKIKAYLILQGANASNVGKPKLNTEAASRPTILFLHANAGNMGHRLPFAHIFYSRLKCNVMMLSYRGYGLSEGRPNEAGIRLDAQLALDYISSHPLLEKTKVVLYGQSIGGAVAIDLAATNPDRIAGVVLENTFLNLRQVAMESLPIATPYIMAGLLREKWDSAKAIMKFPSTLPTLFLSGSMDEIVPPSHFLALHEMCPSERKTLKEFRYGTHNDTCVAPGYWQEIQRFLKNVVSVDVPEIRTAQEQEKEQAQLTPGAQGLGGREGQHPLRQRTFDERRMDGAEKELEGTIGAGSIAP